MKYLFLLLLLTGCSYTSKQACNFDNGRRAFMGLPVRDCNEQDPLVYCKNKCKDELKTVISYDNVSNIYSCSCNSREEHKPKFKVGYCIAYVVVSGAEDGNTGEVIDRPICHVTNYIQRVNLIKGREYILEDVTEYRSLVESRDIEYIDNNYARVNCGEAKLK